MVSKPWHNFCAMVQALSGFTGCKGYANRYYSVFKERCKPLFYFCT
nr:MAG TPA: hypothetical protein [Caudoviricetes sp.]